MFDKIKKLAKGIRKPRKKVELTMIEGRILRCVSFGGSSYDDIKNIYHRKYPNDPLSNFAQFIVSLSDKGCIVEDVDRASKARIGLIYLTSEGHNAINKEKK